MNHNLFKHLKNDPAYSLTADERASMRMRLEALTRAPREVSPAPSSWFFLFMRPMPLAALVLIVSVSSASVSFAAGGALPGDALYGVKVGINEKLELALAPGTEAKANVQVRQAEERLRETEVLAVEGELSPEVAASAADAVAKSVDAAVVAAAKLTEEGEDPAADGIKARIASSLSAHSDLLSAHARNFKDGSYDTLRTLSLAVRGTATKASVRGDEEEGDVDTADVRVAAEAAYARARERLRSLREHIGENGIPDETETELSEESGRLSADLDEAEGYSASEDYAHAARAYDDIDRRAYRALTLLTSAQEISEETDQEVVIVLDTSESPTGDARTARQAKTAQPESVSLMSLTATTSNEDEQEAVSDEEPNFPRLEFRLQDEE